MKKLVMALIMMAGLANADVVISNLTTTATIKASNTVTIAKAKLVYTAISIEKKPPNYNQVGYRLYYFVKDVETGKEVPGTRGSKVMTQLEMDNLATRKGIALGQIESGMESLANAVLRKEIASEL